MKAFLSQSETFYGETTLLRDWRLQTPASPPLLPGPPQGRQGGAQDLEGRWGGGADLRGAQRSTAWLGPSTSF